MFGMPAAGDYDWRFRLVGIPVRVSPWFWLATVLLAGTGDPRHVLFWVPCVFVSILLHEMGHGLMAKAFGYRPQILLFGMGGLCASEAERQTSNQRLAVLAAGPGIQFALLGLVVAFGVAVLGIDLRTHVELALATLGLGPMPLVVYDPRVNLGEGATTTLLDLHQNLFFINWIWPLLNLLPIWPLDGGQITGEVLGRVNPRHGRRWGHVVSMIVAGLVVAWTLAQAKGDFGDVSLFRVLFFGYFAFINYQVLAAYQSQYRADDPDRDPDWWAR
jgi:Zn-dependent protease